MPERVSWAAADGLVAGGTAAAGMAADGGLTGRRRVSGSGLAAWPYYGGYGYDDCIQWGPDWGWVNVCQYPYGGYYPY